MRRTITLTLKPWDDKPHKYILKVFPNKKAMYAFSKRHKILDDEKFAALTASSIRQRQKNGKWEQDDKWLGFVLFDINDMGAGIVSHEMTHAALFALSRVKKAKIVKTWEESHDKDGNQIGMHEELCSVVGDMVRQFWHKYYKHIEPKTVWKKKKSRTA